MCEVIELTNEQLNNRLKLLYDKFGNFPIMINTSNKFEPKQYKERTKFNFEQIKHVVMCFRAPLNYEICTNHYYRQILEESDTFSEKQFRDDMALIVDGSKTYSICSIYVDKDNKRFVLLNGYFNGKHVNWSKLKGDIY